MEVYWIKDKQRRGPATVPDVISLVQMGEISPDTLGWHPGCQGWMPLRELPALADFLNDLHNRSKGEAAPPKPSPLEAKPTGNKEGHGMPSPDTEPEAPLSTETSHPKEDGLPTADQAERKVQCRYLPNPLTRLIARFVDCGLYASLAMGILYLSHVPFSEYLLPTNSLFWAPLVLIEAYCTSRWNTTPGKALLGISISTFGSQQEMGFGRAFSRSVSVFILGMGMFLPLIAGITMLVSYFILTRKGICLWDARVLTLPTLKQPVKPNRVVLGVIIIFFTFQLTSFFMQPWMPAMIQAIEQTSPQTGQMLRNFLPSEAGDSSTPPNNTPQPLS